MGVGYLTVQSRTANGALPLEGVRVRISNQQGQLLYELTTDRNGETKPVPLEAVDRKFSLDPTYSGDPYSIYILDAEKEGYNSLHIADVQIFDGEKAIQPLVLIPMRAGQKVPIQQTLIIGKPAIQMTTPRNPAGPIVEPRILRQVIIPNPITVHLGAPSEDASNVQVTFIDYVKNVGSSEIYSTWPKASLEANIYAIITFALNRVFTQWYRSRGFNFDITNSTAYDQYFVYGRTIYESISQIVDQNFNQYVRREGQIAPFFTAFCNGTTVTCDGLSQWGTVTLADQGMSTMEILRYYFPDDIELSQTNIITGIVEGFPGNNLQLGSTGLDVQVVQYSLKRIKQTYPDLPAITDEEGKFGDSTKAAVMEFQSVFDLTSDGIVGKATWYKISYIYVAVAKLASLESEGTNLGIGTIPPNSVLQKGSIGIDVITLQYILSVISAFYPTVPDLTPDGIFGSETTNSVMAFQKTVGLTANGIVNASTWNALYNSYWGIKNNIPINYTVQSGDTLWLLARRFNTTVEAIKDLNNLTSDVLNIGQTLKIPGRFITYTVQSGDTLWLLAQKFNTTVNAIKTTNNLSSDRILVGQTLFIQQ
ncbi:LysM peptidoglycan-binding domain-containing protein [Pullulanibacillus sp. KACC 23026]|uniref:LysM peptidoglycan-binding domain-containing protein n=1 Tax=Pullulanibacillus sp. KACC 23026 TaxID=3028315 RepID=UPI0023B14648|nr:LysM peptidoglycan-binding domain-containing protein [Pullulanibacillus sp. KACC 23026]WEG11088.1 LysM peptidoglycan-binding domain-containing protein [Pullulanibacillus sp. KACC 23026]